MGVTGLLQHLKEIQDSTSLSKYKGKTLAVDTYGWLHRGLISCAQELCQDVPTKKYINSVMKKIDMLRHFGVEPYLVFDGAYLPTKAETAKERRLKREEAQKKANDLIKSGNRKLAWKEFMKAAGVTPEMAKSIMVELDIRKVKYVVAPYEADPQMVYLEKVGLVDGILSEDSDLLIFGCNRLITKLNDYGECIEICRENFSKVKKIPYLSNYSHEQLRLVAMLSGCDYTKGIPGIGLKTAFSLVKRFNNLEKVLTALRADGKKTPADFEDEVHKADLAFQFQKVFNPCTQKLETLNAYPENLDLNFEIVEECCGRSMDEKTQTQICTGKIHPNTLQILISREQSLSNLKSGSINLGSNTKQPSVNIASRSKSTTVVPEKPKTGSIDSFFSSSKVFSVKNIPVETPGKRQGSQKEQVSPTSRKIRRIANDNNDGKFVSPKHKISKFFGNVQNTPLSNHLPTPVSTKQAIWDSSLVSGDSDVPDEFSSPVQHVRGSQVSQVCIKKVNTESVIEGLTDNDFSDDDLKDLHDDMKEASSLLNISSTSISTSMGTNINASANACSEFGIDDQDDEIDESPVKAVSSEDRLRSFAKVLRERYLMNSSSSGKCNEVKSAINKLNSPIVPIDLNVHSNIDDSLNAYKLPLSKATQEPSKENIMPQNEVNDKMVERENHPYKAQTLNIQVGMERKSGISLQRFAFRG